MIGMGYIGLPTASILADRGFEVMGVDIDEKVLETIERGEVHISEPGLSELVSRAVSSGKLRVGSSPVESDIFLIAVPTPYDRSRGVADLSYIETAVKEVATVLKKGDLVILESTSPVGTTDRVQRWMKSVRGDLTFPFEEGDESDIRIAYCPERVLPGNTLREMVENDRIVGGASRKCTQKAISFYRSFIEGEPVETDARSAEMVKLVENAYRDVQIAFANELSMLCEDAGVDVWKLISLANRHPRVDILRPGCGVGGHCIAVDPWFLISDYPESTRLMKTARSVNDRKTLFVISKIKRALQEYRYRRIRIFGIAFKPDIDDMRESPALSIVESLAEDLEDCEIEIVEPNIETLPDSLSRYPNMRLLPSGSGCTDEGINIFLVGHTPFSSIDCDGEALDFVDIVSHGVRCG
jgi:UDP-N-acetyl-D-mannosaminuronic acid dehydrogenase